MGVRLDVSQQVVGGRNANRGEAVPDGVDERPVWILFLECKAHCAQGTCSRILMN